MSIEKFRRYDLNLLLVLHVLLEERGVSAAAQRLGLSQGAVSRALGRLRDQLGDDLLVRTGGVMTPTPRAEEMRAPLESLLHGLGLLFEPEEDVQPALLEREFVLAAESHAFTNALPAFVASLTSQAPKACLRIERWHQDTLQRLATGELDAIVSVDGPSHAGIVWSRILEERPCTVVRRGHPRLQSELDLDAFVQESHVEVSQPKDGPGAHVDLALERVGKTRRVLVSVPSVALALEVVATSDCLVTVPEAAVVESNRFQIFEPPFDLPRTVVGVGWHERVRRDPVNRWFRGLLSDAVRKAGTTRS